MTFLLPVEAGRWGNSLAFPSSRQMDETADPSQRGGISLLLVTRDALPLSYFVSRPVQTTKAVDVLEALNTFFAKSVVPGKKRFILWPDGPPAKLILQTRVIKRALHVVIAQCFLRTGSRDLPNISARCLVNIHQSHQLCRKQVPPSLHLKKFTRKWENSL